MIKKTTKKRALLLLALTLITTLGCVLFATQVSATYQIPDEFKPNNTPFDISFTNPGDTSGTSALETVLQIIAGALLYFAAPLAVVSIAIAAFMLVNNSGNSEKIETSKKHLTWAVIGLLVIMFSYALVRTLIRTIYGAINESPTQTTQPAATPGALTPPTSVGTGSDSPAPSSASTASPATPAPTTNTQAEAPATSSTGGSPSHGSTFTNSKVEK